jgi:hypothetical protein
MFTKTMFALFTALIVGTSSAALAMTHDKTNASQSVSKSRSTVLRTDTPARETKSSSRTVTDAFNARYPEGMSWATPFSGSGLRPIW